MPDSEVRPCFFIGASLDDLRSFPEPVRQTVGLALYEAQRGLKSRGAKQLKGFGGAGVLEVMDDFDGDTWRAVYTVQLAGAVYVLHCFQKKSKHGVATPPRDLALIRGRLEAARDHHDRLTKDNTP
ncbi:MAG: addiction module toxin RelE [Alphaproteobacteria bacterium]|nr:addiction module toxin RelE [Alphaproteobacteria bacterium]